MILHQAYRHMLLPLLLPLLAACSSFPSLPERTHSHALPLEQATETRLGRKITPLTEAHPELAGIIPLADGHHAFAVRMQLAEVAERSLDIQYYMWKDDLTGILLFDAVREAAERGVRVRILLDDNHALTIDPLLLALDGHPSIEVRLFNPFRLRSARALSFLMELPRLNHRMHNKSFTADNQITIIGGRNIGDEYFAAADGLLFADLDVMAIGPVVQQVSEDFDRYWHSAASYPASSMIANTHNYTLQELALQARRSLTIPKALNYTKALHQHPYITELFQDKLTFEWAYTQMVSDDPAKANGLAVPETTVPFQLREIIGMPHRQLDLVSPYFVPTRSGVQSLTAMSRNGIRVRVLTNSLAATDITIVHSGYARYRRDLLRDGVILYETPAMPGNNKEEKKQRKAGPFGSSGSSLHAKTFAVDGTKVFIGSFNFDPRSTHLNTELGFVIESPTLAQQIHTTFDEEIPLNAYQVVLDEQGRLLWLERQNGQTHYYRNEPGSSFWQRLGTQAASWLPIEWLL